MANDRHILPHSHHAPHLAHQSHSRCHPDDHVDVTVWLAKGSNDYDVNLAHEFANRHGLNALTIHHPNSVEMTGSVSAMEAAFGLTLFHLHHPDGNLYRGHTQPISVPAELAGIITGVFGLDERPVAKTHYRRFEPVAKFHGRFDEEGVLDGGVTMSEPAGAFTPPQLAQLYGFPTGVTGAGQCIAIIELGGGFRPRDLTTYFQSLGVHAPNVTSVSVDGGRNAPTGNPDGPDGEVMLDIEVAGAVAPGAKIVVYFAGNTDRGFMDSVSRAIHDPVNRPSVISISWGGPESNWTVAAMQQFSAICEEAAALGVTILVASGDNGSSDGVDDGANHVDFPASSPWVTAVGGTHLTASLPTVGGGTTPVAAILSEVVWNDGDQGGASGGGYSAVFPTPAWQSSSTVAGRGVPDVAADASPESGYVTRVDGTTPVIGGTSASAPLWAGLIALINQSIGRNVGFLNPVLYANPSACRTITQGNNGAFEAGPGWSATCGLGSPNGAKLLEVLRGSA